ncbi:nitrate- and nitrite sensing domain-containing protein [Lentzea sp. BCCO 10_0856]|uniref:histidine kinase n=1 Tax=Lentzea miocenica TaxID=3095431 RepID=A0ABU4T3Y5_9PSEU|nr:nitrate- and nitrite sensing domain-containing protein [Lentzea sp. BCCO 10_0856]MDX8032871.1 nitrate- and nitrite sensing domain-containing protein [Lentzea sp. BCCO 10_0856]
MFNALVNWRNWRLPVKLAAVLIVPVTIAVGSGVLQINSQMERAESYAALQRLVKVRAALIPVIEGVQSERRIVAEGVGPQLLAEQVKRTDDARAALRDQIAKTSLSEVVTARMNDVQGRVGDLGALRERTDDVPAVIKAYSELTDSMLDVDEVIASEFGDAALLRTAMGLHHVVHVRDQVLYQQAVVLSGLTRGQLTNAEVRSLVESNVKLGYIAGEFAALATPEQMKTYGKNFNGPDIEAQRTMLAAAVLHPTSDGSNAGNNNSGNNSGNNNAAKPRPLPIAAADWSNATGAVVTSMGTVVTGLQDDLRATADRLRDETSDAAGTASAILFASLILAGTIGFVVGRYLLRSLNALRRSALEVAWHKLPEMVATGRGSTEIEPVPVETTEEFGQVARAFDAVHQQAVRSVIEQAGMRANMRNIFVNLSRRSQSLVERQLKLMEELEKYEEDPDQLANLFKLDHLATRMRRNNENLMVLSGGDVARRFTRPIPLTDVLRAAAAEIEQYQRVMVHTAPGAEVVGYVASDLVRLLAELLDNATAFSPPHTQVSISASIEAGDIVQIDVVDHGIGIDPEALAIVNHRLEAAGEGADVQVFREMGLFVVGRLAERHQIVVRLDAQQGKGTRAIVLVPAELAPRREESWESFRGEAIERQQASWFQQTPAATPPPPPAPARQTPESARGFLDAFQRGVQRGLPDHQESR